MKRDKWFSMWRCLPGFILIAATLLPFDHAKRHLGLVLDQWAGVLVAGVMLGITAVYSRKIGGRDGRSESIIREARRINGMDAQGVWFGLGLMVQLAFYFVWGKQYHVAFQPFWAGLFILVGSTCLVTAVAARAWILLGWAIPFLAYGLCLPLAEGHGKVSGVLFGMMFVAVALSFSIIQVWQIRQLEGQHAAH